MPLSQIAILSILEGLTEFLPLPSDALHRLLSEICGIGKPDVKLSVAMQAGALAAVICYYLADLVKITYYVFVAVVRRMQGPVARIGICLLIAGIPSFITILMVHQPLVDDQSITMISCWACIACGLLLAVSTFVNRHLIWQKVPKIEGERKDTLRHMNWQQALIVGIAQVFMAIPGMSRAAITLSAGLFLGLRSEAAARLSFLLAIPVIVASISMDVVRMQGIGGTTGLCWNDLLIGATSSFVSSIVAIHFFLRYLVKSGLKVFAISFVLFGGLTVKF